MVVERTQWAKLAIIAHIAHQWFYILSALTTCQILWHWEPWPKQHIFQFCFVSNWDICMIVMAYLGQHQIKAQVRSFEIVYETLAKHKQKPNKLYLDIRSSALWRSFSWLNSFFYRNLDIQMSSTPLACSMCSEIWI